VKGRRGTLLVAAPIALVGLLVTSGTGAAWAATNWTVPLHTASSGEGHSQTVPSAPTGVTAACNAPTTSKTIKVSWTAVTHATTYTVYDSTTSATGTYSSIATGVTTTSWTSGTLTAGTNYWFEVTASVGSNWTTAKSSATAESTINTLTPFCVQP
jgi:cellulose 1,4-beta-cellobiosidase